jgi:hypothetical protein
MSTELALAEFEARINHARLFVAQTQERLDSLPDRSRALLLMSPEWTKVGLYSTHLRRYGEARAAFQKAAMHLIEGLMRQRTSALMDSGIKNALELALLSGDQGIVTKVAGGYRPVSDKSLTELGEGYSLALLSLVNGDEAGAGNAVDRMATVSDDKAVREKSYPQMGSAVKAILDRDEQELQTALEVILDTHARYATRGHLRGSGAALVCVVAACMTAIARSREMNVEVDDRFHNVAMSYSVTHVEQWGGTPARGQKFKVVVDVLPLALLT